MASARLPVPFSADDPSPSSGSGWGGKALLALGGGLGAASFFAGNDQPDYLNPSNAAKPYLDQVPGAVKPYYQPFMDKGVTAGNTLDNQYNQNINDPTALNNKLGAGYKQSPGYQFKLHQALMAGDNAAAAGGMIGTPAHQQQQMQLGNDIASQDFNDYMSRVLGIYNKGIEGEQGFQKQGFDASTDYGQTVGNSLINQGKLAYMGANSQNEANQAQTKSNSDMWGDLAGTALAIAPYFL